MNSLSKHLGKTSTENPDGDVSCRACDGVITPLRYAAFLLQGTYALTLLSPSLTGKFSDSLQYRKHSSLLLKLRGQRKMHLKLLLEFRAKKKKIRLARETDILELE